MSKKQIPLRLTNEENEKLILIKTHYGLSNLTETIRYLITESYKKIKRVD